MVGRRLQVLKLTDDKVLLVSQHQILLFELLQIFDGLLVLLVVSFQNSYLLIQICQLLLVFSVEPFEHQAILALFLLALGLPLRLLLGTRTEVFVVGEQQAL